MAEEDVADFQRNVSQCFPFGLSKLNVPAGVVGQKVGSRLAYRGVYSTSASCPFGKNLPVLWTDDGFFVLGKPDKTILWIDSGSLFPSPEKFGLRRVNPLHLRTLL